MTSSAQIRGSVSGDEHGSALTPEFAIFADFAIMTKCGSSGHFRALATTSDQSFDGIPSANRVVATHRRLLR